MIKVLIKNPSVKFQDFEVEVEETKTIAELKLHLSLVYPTNPLPGFQKLFFAGKLLRNEETLSSLLQQNVNPISQLAKLDILFLLLLFS